MTDEDQQKHEEDSEQAHVAALIGVPAVLLAFDDAVGQGGLRQHGRGHRHRPISEERLAAETVDE